MNKKYAIYGVLIGMNCMSMAIAAPHWTHAEQAEWGAILDDTQIAPPLMYPFAECTLGTHQSPLDLSGKVAANTLNTLKFHYFDDTTDFFNSGHAAQINTSSGYKGGISVGADFYPLTQYHFHAPSEHVVGSQTYPGELHLVHIRNDGRIAVVGVFLQEGAQSNLAFEAILNHIPAKEGDHNTATGIKISPASLLPKDKAHFYTYAGSLTTPPCSEGVNWYVLAKPVTVSTEQIAKLMALYNKNNRLPQELNGRTVTGNAK